MKKKYVCRFPIGGKFRPWCEAYKADSYEDAARKAIEKHKSVLLSLHLSSVEFKVQIALDFNRFEPQTYVVTYELPVKGKVERV